jgi:hypothetical protein
MRNLAWPRPIFAITAIACGLFLATACDDADKEAARAKTADTASPVIDAGVRPAAVTEAGAAPSASAMPERPVPKPQTMVLSSAPTETQLKAIGYMVAMRAPRPDDPSADDAYASDLVTKLKPILASLDKGADKAKWERIETVGKGRQIDLYMSSGCDPKLPVHAVTQGLGIPLTTLFNHGVLVIRCNDVKQQCLQSTRDPDDVLCTTAPRHK